MTSSFLSVVSSASDRNGKLIPPGRGNGSKAVAHDGLDEHRREEDQRPDRLPHDNSSSDCKPTAACPPDQRNRRDDRGYRHDHQQQELWAELHHQGEGRGTADTQQRHKHGSAATANRLHKMFAEVLDGLLQKENMVPATDSNIADEGGDADWTPRCCGGIEWVEVVRRVSAIAVSFS